jgi:ABC-type nitrate/sulfonate/bicarbonate transport system substrate-binding protein
MCFPRRPRGCKRLCFAALLLLIAFFFSPLFYNSNRGREHAEDLDCMEKLSFAVGFEPSSGHAILFQRKLLKEAKDEGLENCNCASDERTLLQ